MDLPDEQGDRNAFPYRTWQGWANIAEDFAIASDFPAFRARQAVKIALQASEDNIRGKSINSIDIDAAIVAILSGDISATQLPNTQQMDDEMQRIAPIIVLDEQKRRGKRSEHNYLVMFPGQSQEQGEWLTKGQLKTTFPTTWKSMLDAWKETKGGGDAGGPSGGDEESGGEEAADGAADGGGGGEHQASVIQGESNNPEDEDNPPPYQQQQQQRQQMSDRLPSPPLLLSQPAYGIGAGGYQRRPSLQGGQAPLVQLYSQPEGGPVDLLPLPHGNEGVFLPVAAAGISPTGRLQWQAAEQQQNRVLEEPQFEKQSVSAGIAAILAEAEARGVISYEDPTKKLLARRPIAPPPLPPPKSPAPRRSMNIFLEAAIAGMAPTAANPRPRAGIPAVLPPAAKVHPLLRKNLAYAQKNQAVVQQPGGAVTDSARNAARAAGEAVAVEALETLKRRKSMEDEEDDDGPSGEEGGRKQRRRKLMPGPSRNPKSRPPEEATAVPITAAAVTAELSIEDDDEEDEEQQFVDAMDAPMPDSEDIPDTEDEGVGDEELEAEKIEEDDDDDEEEGQGEEDFADFEKEPGLSDEEKERRKQLRLRLQPEMWAEAKLTGAKQTGEFVEIFVKWKDGFDTKFPSRWLCGPKLIHCMDSLIDFYESKTKRRPPKSSGRGAGAAAAGGGGTGVDADTAVVGGEDDGAAADNDDDDDNGDEEEEEVKEPRRSQRNVATKKEENIVKKRKTGRFRTWAARRS